MGHLFYNELEGAAGLSITTIHNSNFALFTNVQSSFYWSGAEYAPDPGSAWGFVFHSGFHGASGKGSNFFAWAVHDGDVGASSVQEPGIWH